MRFKFEGSMEELRQIFGLNIQYPTRTEQSGEASGTLEQRGNIQGGSKDNETVGAGLRPANADETSALPGESPKSGSRTPNGETKKGAPGKPPKKREKFGPEKGIRLTAEEIKNKVDLTGLNVEDSIKKIYAELGINQQALAEALDSSSGTVSFAANGKAGKPFRLLFAEKLGWQDPDKSWKDELRRNNEARRAGKGAGDE